MAKGFARKEKRDDIYVESGVSARTGQGFCHLIWGKNKARFSPQEMRAHAMGLMEAAAAAELDASLFEWAVRKLGASDQDAGKLLMLFRQKREKGKLPSMTLNIDGEHMRPDSVRQAGADMLEMAFGAEMEAFLVDLIIKDVGHSAAVAEQMIHELREMRGATTLYPTEKNDGTDPN